jgi:hypothetical protein
MSAQTELLNCYRQWRHWSEGERGAIAAGDWPALERCQAQKALLQSEILRWTAESRPCSRGAAHEQKEFRTMLQDLIAFETQTAEMLAQARTGVQRQVRELHRSSVKLKRVRQSYGGPREAVWSSYS